MRGREYIFRQGDKLIPFKTNCYFGLIDIRKLKQDYPVFEDFKANLESRGYQVEVKDVVAVKAKEI